ncbi:hypothetical protein [Neobacillus sp. FSL H8-0543]|uniref:hypothetical protein n=1 Tax=Neobacillus sp. FSL H8-0543 TaxID=2954672 RepID=UPI003158D00E
MKVNNKAKWIVGISGAAFSAFVIGQLNNNPNPTDKMNTTLTAADISDSMSKREKELVQLDWSDFSFQANDYQREDESDRITRRT